MLPIVDHESQALATLPDVSSLFERALVALWARRIQALEDQAFLLLAQAFPSTAMGAHLDVLGALVGVRRGALEDAPYRLRILAQVVVNRSRGRAPELQKLFALLTPLSVRFIEEPPAAFVVYVDGGPLADAATSAALLQLARGVGIRAGLLYLSVPLSETFTFAGGGGKGFADPAVPGSGGRFASITTHE